MAVIVTLDHLMRWAAAAEAAMVETLKVIVADQVADQVTMRLRQHLARALLDKEIMAVAVVQTQIHTQEAVAVVQAVQA
jgi:hypothetical protein